MLPVDRFTGRVENYIRFRPKYPAEMTGLFERELSLAPSSVVADIGSGTGISSEPFLAEGNTVFAVEPNKEMREAAEVLLSHYPGFRSIDGTAEQTTLPDQSVDFIVCGQAFHWFDRDRAGVEFRRIARPGASVVLLWNERMLSGDVFHAGYEQLLKEYGTDYSLVTHDNITKEQLRAFLGQEMRSFTLENFQTFDYDGLKGRLLSCSYVPSAGQPGHDAMLLSLQQLFGTCESNGQVTMRYQTSIHVATFG